MNEKLEKPEAFGKGQFTNEHEVKEIKPEQLEMCNYKVIEASTSASENHNFRSNSIVEANANNTDSGIKELFHEVKSLDANRYATKKTIAQGMLDIALLTANASQLKYILQVGKQHEFYTLMLTLICLSIGLQILSGLLSLSLNLMLDRKMEDSRNGYAIEWIGRVRVALSFIVFLDNILIAAFDPMGLSSLMLFDTTSELAIVGVLFIIVGGLDINRRRDQWAANIINDIILIGIFVVSLTNIVISGFGMEFSNKPREILTGANFALRRGIDMNTEIIPIISESLGLGKCSSGEILQGLMFIFVGSSININKERDQHKANIWCNIVLAAMVLTVVINIIISAFGINES